MDNNIIIPKKEAFRSMRPGGGGDYWNEFWKTFGDERIYSSRIETIKTSLNPILDLNVADNKDVYVQVTLDDKAAAKSMQPTDLWAHSNLEVVESQNTQTITLSGTKLDFQKLNSLLSQSKFEKAKKRSDQVNRTDMNLYRECFAMTGLVNKNIDVRSRVDRFIKEMIGSDNTQRLDCIVEIYSNQKRTLYDSFFEKVTEKIGIDNIKKRDERFFFYNMSFLTSLTISQIEAILTDIDFNFVRLIRIAPTFVAERCIPNTNIANTRVLGP